MAGSHNRLNRLGVFFVGLGLTCLIGACRSAGRTNAPSAQPSAILSQLRTEAVDVRPLVTTRLAKDFLAATDVLPATTPRVLYRTADKTRYYSESEAEKLPEDQKSALQRFDTSEEFYYTTKYGTPIAYVRPLELLGRAGVNTVRGARILDFGYGTVGHLRMLSGLGADAVGVDVDPMLAALYSAPTDQGPMVGPRGRHGSVKLVSGRFPAEPETVAAIGQGYDLIISKNTLKNGYLHPAEPVDKRMLVDLGVDDATFVQTLFRMLKPGGRVMIYNICPAPSPAGTPYKPWADGRCPFPRTMWESAGFRVTAFDVQDDAAVREMAHALGWDRGEGAMDLQTDLFAWYTLAEKPRK